MRWLMQVLLGLDGSVLREGSRWRPGLDVELPAWLMLFLVLAVVALSFYVYRLDARGVRPWLRRFLAVLRLLAVLVAILLLLEPVLNISEYEARRSYVIVMVDDSLSMTLKDRYPEDGEADASSGAEREAPKETTEEEAPAEAAEVSGTVAEGAPPVEEAEEKVTELTVERLRAALPADFAVLTAEGERVPAAEMTPEQVRGLSRLDIVKAFLTSREIDLDGRLKKGHRLKYYRFDAHVRPTIEDEKRGDVFDAGALSGEGQMTRLGGCIRETLDDLKGQPIAAVVVFTDGCSNADEEGEDPEKIARSLGRSHKVPVFTVGVGDARPQKNIAVRRLEAPEKALVGDFITAWVTVSAQEYPSRMATVVLRRGKEEVARKEVMLAPGGEPVRAELRFKPREAGDMRYTARIEPLPGEILADDNEASARVAVTEDKLRVLYVEGQDLPRFEYRYLKNAFLRDHTLEISCLLASSDGSYFYEGNLPLDTYPTEKKDLYRYDVIIFGDVEPRADFFSPEQLEMTKNFVLQEGGGFLMLAGERHAPLEYVDTPIADLLPVVVSNSDPGLFDMVRPKTEPYRPEITREGWANPILRLEGEETANRETWADLPGFYWYFPVPKAKRAAQVLARHPFAKGADGEKRVLVATQIYGAGRTMFMGVDEVWRWRYGYGDRYFYRFYAQALRYLAAGKRAGQNRRFQVEVGREEYNLGERVRIVATVRDEEFDPLRAPGVKAHVRVPGRDAIVVELAPAPNRPGEYIGEFAPEVRGDYTAWLKDEAGRAADECTFSLRVPRREFERTRMNRQLLRNMAAASAGGTFLSLGRVKDLPDRVPHASRQVSFRHSDPLWDNWRLFVLFTILVVTEWALRKRANLL